MPKNKRAKVRLSEALEGQFFQKKLSKAELSHLKKHCEAYHQALNPSWKPSTFRPYSSYLGFLTALKAKSVLAELKSFGYLSDRQKAIIDYGGGTLGASLGAIDCLPSQFETVLAVDREPSSCAWAFEEFSEFLPQRRSIRKSFPKKAYGVVLMANVWAEVGLRHEKPFDERSDWVKRLLSWIKLADEDTIFVFIEPASYVINQNLLKLRDILKRESHVLLPCTHELACPALKQDEWCHEDRAYAAPNEFWQIVKSLGFRKQGLNFSLLCLGKQANRFRSSEARVVSGDLSSKGKCQKWLCSKGQRWKEEKLLRQETNQNKSFFDAQRGDVIDCNSTQSHPSD